MTTAVSAAVALVDRLVSLLGAERVLSNRADLLVYECDGYVIEKNSPDVAVFPETTEEVAAMVTYLCSPLASATTGAALRVDGGTVKSAF